MINLELIKKTSAYRILKKDVDNNSLSHAYLIVGEDKLARESFFIAAAMLILCKKGGCGECDVCERIVGRLYPDVYYYKGEDKLNVETISSIIEAVSLHGVESEKKLFFIDEAERMLPPVQNKFLKTYEEPIKGVSIFLGVNNEASLLQTIRSRAKKIYLEPFSREEIYAELLERGMDNATATVVAACSQGSFERVEMFSGDPKYRELYDGCFEVLLTLKKSSQMAEYIFRPMFDKDNIKLSLYFMEIILCDCMHISVNERKYIKTVNKDFDIEEIAKGFSPAGLSTALFSINEGRNRLNSYVNSTSVIEKILFDILEAKQKWS